MTDVSWLSGAGVLAVGDVMLDEYLWGNVRRISPEAPVPVVEIQRRTHAAGGAANVAAGVMALEGRAFLAGVVGDDPAATALLQTLAGAGVDTDAIVVDRNRPTTSKTRVIAHAQQVVRTDHEARGPLATDIEDELQARIEQRIQSADTVVLSDYRKGVVSERIASGVIQAAAAAAKPVVVDPKGLDYSKYRGATVLTPNVGDAAQAANVHLEVEADVVMTARRLSDACGGAALLMTRGADGMSLFTGSARVDVAARARDVYDVTGAGDTVVAVLAVALGRGASLAEAVELANAAAGVVVGKVGTSTVTLEELGRALEG
jgi:D-glycero-beta-D-manno-heptose-7-phosphate kinase